MKHTKHILVAIMALSIATTHTETQLQKVRNFLSKHKNKIVAGVVAAAGVGLALGLAYHGNKTLNAIEQAEIQPSDTEFETAVAVVGLLGPLGEERTLQLIKNALAQNIITGEQAAGFLLSDTGTALAYYYGANPVAFKARVARAGIQGYGQALQREVKSGFNNLERYISRLFK